MIIKRASGLSIVLSMIIAAAPAYSQDYEYREYIVKDGDTLWNISSNELTDPFLWPMIWKENPEIKHPDMIYPDQKIRIPLYLLQKEIAPPARKAPEDTKEDLQKEPDKKIEISDQTPKEEAVVREEVISEPKAKDILLGIHMQASGGYIADILDSRGEIIGSPSDRVLLGKNDYAYIITDKEPKEGDRFYIIRSLGKVKHPDTGDFMGYLIEITGIAEVAGQESGYSKVKIIASFSEVFVGDILNDYYEIKELVLPPVPRTPDIAGFVIAARQRRILNADHDMVYIDKGRNDGIEIGDIIETISAGRFTIPSGAAQVIGLRDKTATAIVRRSNKEIKAGDKIGAAKKKEHSGL